jgi:23S rRNA pseudouridine1911/1915/1917 synthase
MESQTVIDVLTQRFPSAKMNTLREMVQSKRVLLNGMPVKSLKQSVGEKDKFEISDTPVAAKKQTLDEHLKLVYQDADILIVDKPAGLLTATDEEERRPTVLKILADYVQRTNNKAKALLIHRLDREASGLLVFARNENAFHALKEQFYKHTCTRRYDVLVHGTPKKREGTLEHILQEDEKTGRVRVTTHARLGRHAELEYAVISSAKGASHLRCTLKTGRKHQIRVQLAAIGHPVLGDPAYAGKLEGQGPDIGRMALHASVLAFEHPKTKRQVRFDSPLPGSFTRITGN